MKILLISLWYKPEPVAKPHNLARALALRGHSVTSVTSFPNYPKGELYEGYTNRLRLEERTDGVAIVRVRAYLNRNKKALGRVLSYFSFSFFAVVETLRNWKSYDAIWTYQIGLPGTILSVLKKIPHYHEIQDLWPEWGRGEIRGLNTILFRILQWQQLLVFKQAKLLITITNSFREIISKTYLLPHSKIVVIENWADANSFSSIKMRACTDKARDQNKFIIAYGGNIGIAQGLDVVLDAAEILSHDTNIVFRIAGDGVCKRALEELAKKRVLNNLEFSSSMPQLEMGCFLASADVLLISLAALKEYEITMPSKFYAYIALGKPILAVARGEVKKIVEKYDIGITSAPGDAESLAIAIHRMARMPEERRREMGARALELSCELYSEEKIVAKYEKVFIGLSSPAWSEAFF